MHPQTQSQHFSLARGLASLGRGSDTNLVHISDKEINGLKTLAAKSGGSLTVNPRTGLYEAGWLENILPMVAGAALSFTGVGAPAAALMVAAADTAATKDWKSGLAAGLGAFGGAGIGAGLAGAGASAAGDASGVIGSDVAGTAASGAASGATDAAGVAAGAVPTAGAGAASDTAAAAASDTTGAAALPPIQAAPVPTDAISAAGQASPAANTGLTASQGQAAYNQASLANNSYGTNASNAAKGLGQFASNPGQTASDVYASTGKLGLAGLAAPAAYANYKQSQIPTPNQPYKYYSTTYNQGTRNPYAGELGQDPIVGQSYSSPTSSMYTPITFAGGGPVPNIHPIQQPTPMPTNPVPSPGASQADQLAYYQSLVNTPSTGNNVSSPPSPNAQQQYLQQLQSQIQGTSPVPTSMGGAPPKSTTQPVNTGSGYNPATQSYGNLESQNDPGGGGGQYRGANYPTASNGGGVSYNASTGQYTYAPTFPSGGSGNLGGLPMAKGGLASLGHYSDGGNLLKGPGDGMSDSIPAQIGQQKAALANNEFVVPADVVSHLGNGSTDAGSQKLYKMLDRVRKARTGKTSQAPQINADKMLPG